MMRPRLSRIGLAFGLAYLALVGLCVWASVHADAAGDQKGAFVFLQLPLAPQLAALDGLGLGPVLAGMSWPAGYLFVGVPTLGLLYLLGWLLGRAAKAVRRA
ncbi:hypothetical protein LJR143_003287 [Pseudoxanthomonas sp. LjRoot143]|uniref:hypothetical protein n=1 Tax=Pseudoxanthomonas sp. LjRoot143 TaxID=3342266 RepID=UPI003ECFDDA5